MTNLKHLSQIIEESIQSLPFAQQEPQNLYQPILYAMSSGGKRIRPLLTLIACDTMGGDIQRAIPVALAHEIFHNFTLLHDDVMDNSPMRRGHPSVMKQYGINNAILSGDAMLINSFQLLQQLSPQYTQPILSSFLNMAQDVMEGQQRDMDFENREQVSINEYLEMIRQKTAVLLASATYSGAIMADASDEESKLLYDFALNLGMAFQLQDDYLDVYGNAETFGKPIGGDIIECKKTIMYLTALEQATEEQRARLFDAYRMPNTFAEEKIVIVQELFHELSVSKRVRELIDKYTSASDACLEQLENFIGSTKRIDATLLRSLGNNLRSRTV